MNIFGSGHVSAGDYNEKISASGSARLDGNVRCIALSCSVSVHASGNVECKEDISSSGSGAFEKDVIAIEHVNVPKVVGRVVAIGEGCDIELVQYSDEIELHPDAKVGRCEKI